MQFQWKQFAADYDCNAYGVGNYNSNACATTDTGGLVPTGNNVMIGLVGGVLLVVLAVVLLVTTLRRKKKSATPDQSV